MEENNYCIYGHKNKINGKWYIGQTVHGDSPERRWGKDGNGYKTQALFARAIDKYGWINFEHVILKENLTKEEADYWEKYYIKHYNSKENGYNLTEGGEGTVGLIPSEESRKKMSEARKGEKNHFFGKHHSKEARKKISDSRKGKKWTEKQRIAREAYNISHRGENHPRFGTPITIEQKTKDMLSQKTRKKIYCIETKEKFNSIREATRVFNINRSHLSQSIGYSTRSVKGYHFVYLDENEELSLAIDGDSRKKQIICIETNEIFACAKDCAEKMNINKCAVQHCCTGLSKTAGGYHFKYYED